MEVLRKNSSPKFIADKIVQGKVIIVPTDTVYGIACDASNEQADKKIYLIKKQQFNKPNAVLFAHDYSLINKWVSISSKYMKDVKNAWPGATTFILPSKKNLPLQGKTLGVRVPNHEKLLEVLKLIYRPLVATSLNESGKLELRDKATIVKLFEELYISPTYFWNFGTIAFNKPSKIIDLTNNKKVIRN